MTKRKTNDLDRADPLFEAKVRTFVRRISGWFDLNGRDLPWRRPEEPLYRLVVTEVLLQRTRAETVADFYEEFFSRFPDWKSLATATTCEIGAVLKPIGMWRQRAPRLKGLAEAVVANCGRLPRTRAKLELMPGIGQYVANAALLFQEIESAPLLDVGMARVLERYFGPRKLADIRFDSYLQELAASVVGAGRPIRTNWAILDLAALVCTPRRPMCESCPLIKNCRYRFIACLRPSGTGSTTSKDIPDI